MSHVVFLAPAAGAAGVVYGSGHTAILDAVADEIQIRQWQSEGKVSAKVSGPRNIRVAAIGTTTAQIAWVVDQSCTNMRVDYSTTMALNLQQAATPSSGVGDIVANLTGLTTATTYNYRVWVASGTPYTYSTVYSFTTL